MATFLRTRQILPAVASGTVFWVSWCWREEVLWRQARQQDRDSHTDGWSLTEGKEKMGRWEKKLFLEACAEKCGSYLMSSNCRSSWLAWNMGRLVKSSPKIHLSHDRKKDKRSLYSHGEGKINTHIFSPKIIIEANCISNVNEASHQHKNNSW